MGARASASGDLYEFNDVKDKPIELVWTVVDTDEGHWIAVPGFHVVNKVGYVLTDKPWDDDSIEAYWFEHDVEEEVVDKAISPELVTVARSIAMQAHADQLDKAGLPYLGHVSRVAARFVATGDLEAEAVAWLHDVIEDRPDLEPLVRASMPDSIVQQVVLLTRTKDVTPEAYYRAIRQDDVARRVKIGDIKDNLDRRRLQLLPSKDRERLKRKYRQALLALRCGWVSITTIHGDLVADADTGVLRHAPEFQREGLDDIVKIDMAEYWRWRDQASVDDSEIEIQLDDVGHWLDDGTYVEADEDARRQQEVD